MSESEILAVFDHTGRRIGARTREAVHRDHDWHWLVFVWSAWRASDGRTPMLLQQRSRPDDPFASSLDALAGGHVAAHEGHRQAACRELLEEVSIDVPEGDLIYLGQRSLERHAGHCQRVIQHFYLWDRPVDLMSASFSDEVNALVEVDVEELAHLLAGSRKAVEGRSRRASAPDEVGRFQVTAESFSAYPEPILDVFRRSLRAVGVYLLENRIDPDIWRD